MEELQRRLREAERRADQERQRADQERQRADQERQRADGAEEQIRQTTFDEYLALCHSLLFAPLRVQQDRRLTSKGPLANPRDKLCPTRLLPWQRFLEQQRDVFDTLYEYFPLNARVFEPRAGLAAMGRRVSARAIGDEKALEYFMHISIEDPIRYLIDELQKVEAVGSVFDLGEGVVFENHPHAISETSEEVIEHTSPSPPQTPQTPDHTLDLDQLRPDQICVYRSSNGGRRMIYVTEYKAPHKLRPPSLRAGLRPMDIHRDVVNRATIPPESDTDARFQYNAEKLTASALTQTYHYMIEGGLDYGMLTTGETTVFLKVDWTDPGTLYYHLAEPDAEVPAHPEGVQSSSAVGQHLAFTLMALGPPGARMEHGQDERDRAKAGLDRWAVDFEVTLRSIPDSERLTSESGSSWAPTTYEDFDRSPAGRKRGRRRSSIGDWGERLARRRDEPSSTDDEEGPPRPPHSPTPLERKKGGQTGGGERRRSERTLARRPSEPADPEAERQYCTQRCLRGLVDGGELDMSCPNADSHKQGQEASNGCHHPISHATWLQLLTEQLRQTLDRGVVKLNLDGARGVLFKVTLLEYGYTVACKGTVKAFVRDLEHEAAVYERLKRLQGTHVPVFLGAIDLRPLNRTYYYDHRVYIIHMSFMSWGGETADWKKLTDQEAASLRSKAIESLHAIHGEGVAHKDVRSDNMLVNAETGTVMVIDFERSALRSLRRHLLPSTGAVAKKKEASSTDHHGGRKRRRPDSGSFRADLLEAKSLFTEFL